MCIWKNKIFLPGIFIALSFVICAHAQISPEDRHFIQPQYSKTISMDFKNAALEDVLKIFSKQSGMNFITAGSIGNKKITLFLDKIPVEEALEKILKANDLEYDIQPGSDIFVVYAKNQKENMVTRVYLLKHASVPSSKVNSTIKIGSSTTSSSSTSSFGPSTSSAGGSTGGYAAGIYAAVKAVLSKSGIMIEDTRTNSLIITDAISQFPLIEETIAKLDVPVAQILIEVEMLDISKSTSQLMGVKFGSTPLSFTGAEKATLLPFNQSDYLSKRNTVPPVPSSDSGSSGGSSSSEDTPYTAGTISAAGMTMLLQFLKTQTDTRNLARPRLLTLNNETAEIKISTNEAIGVTTSNFGSSSATQSAVEAERVQTGVFLTVTPQANPSTGQIKMAVSPKVIQARRGGTFDNHTFNDPEERGSQSILIVQDGETIIIGGLLRTDDQNTITKVPFFGDIPLLGMAFRHKDKGGTNRELVIFLTPHIVNDEVRNTMLHKTKPSLDLLEDGSRSDEVNRALSVIEQKF